MSNRERYVLALVLFLIAAFVFVDAITDLQEGGKITHVAIEILVALIALVGVGILVKSIFETKRDLQEVRQHLSMSQIEVEKWKAESQKHVQGLSQAIDDQLSRWNLSPAEKEVALLLLKGLSLKEIAEIRNTSEKTARAQSLGIYQKSGLAGRSELSAFFLEDLLQPTGSGKSEI